MWPFLSKQPRLSVTFPCTHNRKRKFNTTEGTMCIPTANIIKQRHNYSNTNRPPKEHSPAAYTSGDTTNNKTIGIQMEHNDAQHKCIQVQHRRSFDDLCVAANRPRWCLGFRRWGIQTKGHCLLGCRRICSICRPIVLLLIVSPLVYAARLCSLGGLVVF